MNYLELCQELARKAGISGSIVAVSGQSGEALRVVNWVGEAYLKIQNLHADWEFKRRDVLFPTIDNNNTYTANAAGVADFGDWRHVDGWRCYATASGVADECGIPFCSYDRFKQVYGYGSNRLTRGRPQIITERPDQSLVLWPTPDAAYTIVGEQYRGPHLFTANEDVPLFPTKYHHAIVYRALMLYAQFEGDPSVYVSAQNEYNQEAAKLKRDFLPEWEHAGPMA